MLEILGNLIDVVLREFKALFLPNMRFFPAFIGTSMLAAIFVFRWSRRRGAPVGPTLLGFLFPKHIYWHPSARVDYLFAIVNRMIKPLIALPLLFGPVAMAAPVHAFLTNVLGVFPPPFEYGWAGILAHALAAGLAADFGIFLVHYIQHRSSVLWEFHKVHHSAEVMTPITVLRVHPVDDLLTAACVAVLLGLVHGTVSALYDGAPGEMGVFGANILFILFYATAYHLRHSHIWLSFPPWLSRWLVSPAQHQIHHSSAERHWNRNMGFIFATWDRLFGTLYVPTEKEEFELGLSRGEHKEYNSVAKLYFLPFRKAATQLARRPAQSTGIFALCGIALVATVVPASSEPQLPEKPPSLELAELTWLEVERAVEQNYRTIILPTGGVEQNGPHVILGKHNHIVRHNALAIAEALGHTLVAPVVAYVPEGKIEPPDGHMLFAGTLSVTEDVFEGILEGAARSLRAAGFELIVLLGDSGGNQEPQARVAARLNKEWRDRGGRMLHVDDYYSDNQQTEWLAGLGETAATIGEHAGIRDTSELMVVHSQGVREAWRRRFAPARAAELGLDGDPSRASFDRGRRLLFLKINAAIRQIQPHLPQTEPQAR